MDIFQPGDHGSTFGGNPLAAAVGLEALDIIVQEDLPARAASLGAYPLAGLREMRSPLIRAVRGRGLLTGVEIDPGMISGHEICALLARHGILSKETHETVLRFAPPLIITKAQIDWALERIAASSWELEQQARHTATLEEVSTGAV